MKRIKLYRLLQCLEKRELAWLEKFLASPYFNSSPRPLKLWQQLKGAHPHYEQLDKAQLFQALRPGEPFDAKFINDSYSELSQLVEEFMSMQEYRRDSHLPALARRGAFCRRKLYPQFEAECRRQIRHLEEQPLRDAENLAAAFSAYEALYGHPESISHSSGGKEAAQAMDCLDHHFLLLKLKYMSDLLARQLTYAEAYDIRFEEAALAEAAQLQESAPLIGLYYRISRLFLDGCPEEDFRIALESFYDLAPQLPVPEQAFIVDKLTSLANAGAKKNRQFYLDALFGLMQYGESRRLFIHNGVISDGHFLNACVVGAHSGEYEWADRFIENNRRYLPASVAEGAYTLAKARLLFDRKEYLAAHFLLDEVHKKQIAYNIRIRSLNIRCLLGMHLEDPTYYATIRSALLAFSRFVGRDKELSAERKSGYLNFGKAVKRIAELRVDKWNDLKARAAAADWINALHPMELLPWLLGLLATEKPGPLPPGNGCLSTGQ